MASEAIPTKAHPEKPAAARTYTLPGLGTIALTLEPRPAGHTLRRRWWPIPEPPDERRTRAGHDTRRAAIQTLRYWHATLNAPTPTPVDHTLEAIQATRREAGAGPAAWLAAGLAAHHIRELEAQRQANPPALWREMHRIATWLDAATHENDHDTYIIG